MLAVNVLAAQLGLMVLATVVAGAFCAAVAYGMLGPFGVLASGGAVLASLPVGALVMILFHRLGAAPEAILLGTFLRLGLTLASGAALATVVQSLWVPAFFITLAVIYLVNLGIETWVVYEKNRRASGLTPSS